MRIGLIYPGDSRLPTTWSGTPAGLGHGLAEAGAEIVHLRAEPARPVSLAAIGSLALLRRSRAVALASPELARLRSAALHRRLRVAGRLDGLVQIGTGYRVRADVPVVTYEDMTIPQALAYPYPAWSGMPERSLAARIAMQGEAYAAADACCLTNEWAARSVVDDYGTPAGKVHVVGVGRNRDPLPAARDWSTSRFLWVGMDWERKNGERVLRAFRRLRAEVHDARLDLVGNHPAVTEPGVVGHGVLSPADPAGARQLERLFEQATCFVMPSILEPSAIVYAEAAAAGLPSIGTKVGGSATIVGEAGRMVDPGSDDELLEAMRHFSDPEVAANVGAIARARSELFTWRQVAERMLRALRPPGVAPEALAAFL